MLIYQSAGHRLSPSSVFPFLVSTSRSLVPPSSPHPYRRPSRRQFFRLLKVTLYSESQPTPLPPCSLKFLLELSLPSSLPNLLSRVAPGLTPSKKETTVTRFPRPTTSRRTNSLLSTRASTLDAVICCRAKPYAWEILVKTAHRLIKFRRTILARGSLPTMV